MVPVIMPQIGQDSPKGRIVQWLKHENDSVQKGEVLLTVESEKAVFEVTAEQAGVLLKILYPEDTEVDILQPLAYLGEADETLDSTSAPTAAAAALAEPDRNATTGEMTVATAMPPPELSRQLASPAVRRLARKRGIDMQTIKGTGPEGRITNDDVESAWRQRTADLPSRDRQAGAPNGPGGDSVVLFSRMRQRIADRLTLSMQTIPHFYLFAEVNMGRAQERRAAANRQSGIHLTVTDLLIKAVALTLRDYPRLNAFVERDRMILQGRINIGVATAIEGEQSPAAVDQVSGLAPAIPSDGLLVPVIAEADCKSVVEISSLSREVTAAARRGVVDISQASTFTISSLGTHGISQFLPIINPPECAILGIGAITPRAVPCGDGLEMRQMMTVTMACDHRAVDGAYAAGFLNALKRRLEDPGEVFSD